MKMTMRNLTGVMLIVITAIGSGQPQASTKELNVHDIEAQQPHVRVSTSAPCIRARENSGHHIAQRNVIDPKTLAQNLDVLMHKSDEVILAGVSARYAFVLSPSGESVAGYFDVRVIRSWKGSHQVGDLITFGLPAGVVHCAETEEHQSVYFSTVAQTPDWKRDFYVGPFVLFLRQSQGKESQLVQGLLPAGGAGLQGMFPVDIAANDEAINPCTGIPPGSLRWCDSFLETSQYPVVVPYVPDPLGKKYDGMPIADFLNEVRNLAADQGLDEKRP